MKQINPNDNQTITNTTSNISWGSPSNIITFFASSWGNTNNFYEHFTNKFYWMYCSNECLTDDEIQQVIEYNENLGSFGINPESMSFDYTGGTSALTITSEESWAASIGNDWLTLSSTSGTGDSTINITAQLNKGQERTGYVNVTDGSNTLVCTISQKNYPIIVPYNNLYINGNRIN